MKRLAAIFITFVVIYSIYYDLTTGTLPMKTIHAEVAPQTAMIDGMRYAEIVVEPGYTVLSVVEHLHDGPIPASIQEIVFDFEQLNGIKPEEMKVGKTYRFPLYE